MAGSQEAQVRIVIEQSDLVGPVPGSQECDELRLSVTGLCLGVAGERAGKRCKWLIIQPLKLKIRVSVVRFCPWPPF